MEIKRVYVNDIIGGDTNKLYKIVCKYDINVKIILIFLCRET